MGLWCAMVTCAVRSQTRHLGFIGPLYGVNNSKHQPAHSTLPSARSRQTCCCVYAALAVLWSEMLCVYIMLEMEFVPPVMHTREL